jgi:hypothetical protein
MTSKCLLKGSGVLFSLLLPVFSVWLVWFTIEHIDHPSSFYVRSIGVITGFYAFSVSIALSPFCRKMSYRIVVAVLAFLMVGMCIWAFKSKVILLTFTLFGAVSVNILPRKWNKYAWLMLPCIVIRAVIIYVGAVTCWEFLLGEEARKADYFLLLYFTYWPIFITLGYDLIIYCFIKFLSRKKGPAADCVCSSVSCEVV